MYGDVEALTDEQLASTVTVGSNGNRQGLKSARTVYFFPEFSEIF